MVAPLTITATHSCDVVVTSSFECESQTAGGGSSGAAWDQPNLGSYRILWGDTVSGAYAYSPQLTMAGPRARYAIEWQFQAAAGRTITIELQLTCGLGYKLIASGIEMQVEVIKR